MSEEPKQEKPVGRPERFPEEKTGQYLTRAVEEMGAQLGNSVSEIESLKGTMRALARRIVWALAIGFLTALALALEALVAYLSTRLHM